MKVRQYLSRNQTKNAAIIVIGSQFFSFMAIVLFFQVRAVVFEESIEFKDFTDVYESIALLFFDAGGSIYTVLIGILAAGITLFSQTGSRMSENHLVAGAQFKYFDMLSFGFNSAAALLGALLLQSAIFDLWGCGVTSPVGTALVGSGVVWFVCSMLAPANFVARVSQVEDLRYHEDRLRAYRSALADVSSPENKRHYSAQGFLLPLIALFLGAGVIGLSRLDVFRVEGGASQLSYEWWLILVVAMALSFGACVLIATIRGEQKVSRLVNDSKNQVVNTGIFVFICMIVAIVAVFVALSIVVVSPSFDFGWAVIVYLFIFGVTPVVAGSIIGLQDAYIWRSSVKQITKSLDWHKREVEMRSELINASSWSGCNSNGGAAICDLGLVLLIHRFAEHDEGALQ